VVCQPATNLRTTLGSIAIAAMFTHILYVSRGGDHEIAVAAVQGPVGGGAHLMSREYSVPKRKVRARVVLSGQPAAEVHFYLSDRAETREGPERPSDLLNGSLAFLPALDHLGQVVLLHHHNLMIVSVAARDELGEDDSMSDSQGPGEVTVAAVHLVLEEGTIVSGIVSYSMPEFQRRLQDFLNTTQRFLVVRQGDDVHLVNKRRITKISTDGV
jgi:hypothetical protein